VSASARTPTTGIEGEAGIVAIGREDEPDTPIRLPRLMTAEPAPSFACQRNWPETAAPRIWTPSGFDRWCGVAGQGAHPIWRIPGVRHPATWPRRAIRAGRNRPGVSLPRRRVGFLPAPQDRRFSACPPYRARGCTARPKAKPSAGGRRVEDDRAPRWRRNPSRSQQSGCRSQSRVESADALMPDVTLRWPATPARQRFLVRAMAKRCAPPAVGWPRPRRLGGVRRARPGACRRSGRDPLGDARQR
jgi:hypothetical protein